MDRSHRPHRHPTQQTREEVELALRVQRHNKRLGVVCLWIRLRMRFGYKRSLTALYKLLRREGVLAGPKKRSNRKPKPYEPILVPGERMQMDVKYVPKDCLVADLAGKKLYQYTVIDECTRWRHVAIFDELSTHNSVEFLYQVLERFPFEISCIQTDNGAEFTSRYTGSRHPSAFEAELAAFRIRHKLIAPATPRHNGKVERSHRSDQERFYNDNKFYSLRQIKQQISRYLRASNRLPLMAHSWRSAQQMLENYQYVL
jgi:transposase InsO family protein